MKKDFKPFKVGTVFNPMKVRFSGIRPRLKSVKIRFPSRLNAMALDPGKITTNKNLVYSPGEVIFVVKIYKDIHIRITKEKGKIEISNSSRRRPLIKHAALLMKSVLGVDDGLYIDVRNEKELKHCGLGSSSSLIAGVAAAVNEIYGNPVGPDLLARYAAQNHGEEISANDDYLVPVQCIGGSAVGGLFDGGLKVIAGETCLIQSMNIPQEYKAVIGVPKDFEERDSKVMMDLEIKSFNKFLKTGLKFGKQIAYNILHKLLPAMVIGDLSAVGDVIFDYRFNMGSIENCSFVYPKLIKLTNKLSDMKRSGLADVLAISSVGPAIFVVTKNLIYCKKIFEKNGLKTIVTRIENGKYKIISKKYNGSKRS